MNEIANSDVIADAQYEPSPCINALYQARMWSAQRETERHADMIPRRGLAGRGGHLRAVARPGHHGW
jgi:hypothetical protein